MKYHLDVPQKVRDSILDQAAYLLREGAPIDRVDRWMDRLDALMQSLVRMPRRFPVAERESAMFGEEVRRVNQGDYAIFYFVHEAPGVVEVLAFRHGKRLPWMEKEDDEV